MTKEECEQRQERITLNRHIRLAKLLMEVQGLPDAQAAKKAAEIIRSETYHGQGGKNQWP